MLSFSYLIAYISGVLGESNFIDFDDSTVGFTCSSTTNSYSLDYCNIVMVSLPTTCTTVNVSSSYSSGHMISLVKSLFERDEETFVLRESRSLSVTDAWSDTWR